MIKWLIRWRLRAFERRWGYDTSYLREMLDADLGGFVAFARAQGLASRRKAIPVDAYYAAKLASVVGEDCGPCTQLLVGMALAEGVAPETVAAVIEGRDELLADGPRLAARFARASLAHEPAAQPLRDEIVAKWGERALVSIAFAILAGRMYPTIKYALGHGRSCQQVTVAGTTVRPSRAAG
jgi:hypothetical protein